jgi:hypothetical protein
MNRYFMRGVDGRWFEVGRRKWLENRRAVTKRVAAYESIAFAKVKARACPQAA